MSRRNHFKAEHRQTSYLPLEEWPASDRTLWQRVIVQGDVFDEGGRGTSWQPRTAQNVIEGYGAWLKWVTAQVPDALALEPRERVTRARIALYKEALFAKPLAPATVQLHLQRLGQMMAAASETREFGWLFEAANRIRAVSVRNKRARTVPSYRLADLGFRLMQEAQTMPASWHRPPEATFRNGLLIAFLAYRPVRLANLTQMTIGQHICPTEGGYVVRFSQDETKTGVEIEFAVPASLTECFDVYLEAYRPKLLGDCHGGERLWISRDGGPLTPNGITATVCRETRAAFGFHVNPHMFRDCAATTIALDDPEHAFAIAGILGHANLTTSEKHYNQARMVEAGSAVHAVLAKYRKNRAS